MTELPFTCPSCAGKFGFGDGARIMGIIRHVPFKDQPTPCCGALITGHVERDHWDRVEITITESRES